MIERRQFKRIVRPLNLRFCYTHENPPQWNLSSFIENISIGGVKFIASGDLTDKMLKLEIQSPRWEHHAIMLEGKVLESIPSDEFPSHFIVRVQFINVSEENKKNLSLLENEDPKANPSAPKGD
jgi:hypothetical protein